MAELERECEVVVVGAGYSGLAAARHLARSGAGRPGARCPPPGRRPVLHRRHPGRVHHRPGRSVDRPHPGPPRRAGRPSWGCATFPTYTTGQGVELRDGARDLYVGLIPTSDPHGAADGIAAMLDLDLAAFEVPPDAPWDAPDAAALDAQTLATWFDAHLSLGVGPGHPGGRGQGRLRHAGRASSRSSSRSSTSTPAAG